LSPFCAGRLAPALVAVALALGLSAAPGLAETQVRVTVKEPAPGVTVRGPLHQARIRGRATTDAEGPERFDLMLVLDISQSTKVASGADVDGDGVVGVNPREELLPPGSVPPDLLSTDPQDDILHAQVAAAAGLLASLDSARVRVGLVTFAGEVDPTTGLRLRVNQADAWLITTLTHDFDRVRAGLLETQARGARGATNYAAGIRLAVRELAGLSGAYSQPDPAARKVILFLTDGIPTLPVGKGNVHDPGDGEAALRAAELAQHAGITINTYALGPQALRYPKVLTEMARVTRGSFTPVQQPGDIVFMLRGTSFANVEDVVFTNLTTGEFSSDVALAPDGSFTGFVPVRDGTNRVRVSVLASDGSRSRLEFDFQFKRADLPGRGNMAELERIRRQNKALELHRLEVEIKAFRAEQRKEVEIKREQRTKTP